MTIIGTAERLSGFYFMVIANRYLLWIHIEYNIVDGRTYNLYSIHIYC